MKEIFQNVQFLKNFFSPPLPHEVLAMIKETLSSSARRDPHQLPRLQQPRQGHLRVGAAPECCILHFTFILYLFYILHFIFSIHLKRSKSF